MLLSLNLSIPMRLIGPSTIHYSCRGQEQADPVHHSFPRRHNDGHLKVVRALPCGIPRGHDDGQLKIVWVFPAQEILGLTGHLPSDIIRLHPPLLSPLMMMVN